MSQDVKQKTKRERISTNQGDQVEVIQKGESQTQQKEAYWKENANVPMDEFDWDAHQAECPTMFRKPNPKINAPHGVKVFSREPYAQDMLNLLMGFEAAKPAQMEVTEGGIYTGTVYSINQEFAAIDIGYRENVYVNMLKEEAGVKPLIVVYNEVKVQVLSKGNTRGYVLGSVSAGVKTAVVSDIMSSIEGGTTAYVGTISEMIPGGGYIVNIQGVDTVDCQITSANGCVATLTTAVLPAEVIGDIVDSNVCNGYSTVLFNNTSYTNAAPDSIFWSASDGYTSNDTTFNHVFPAPGSYTVEMIVTNSANCIDTVNTVVEVFENPVASFGFDDVCLGQTAVFEASSSLVGGDTITNYWYVNNDTLIGDTVTVYFNGPNNYLVDLVAMTENGCSDTVSQNFTVFNNPTANFAVTESCIDLAVQFDNTTTGLSNSTTFEWLYNNQILDTTVDLSYIFNTPGIHNISLVATDSFSPAVQCDDTISYTFFVHDYPTFAYLADTIQCEDVPFVVNSFPAISTSEPISYTWEINGALEDTTINLNTMIPTPGVYQFTYSVVSDFGCEVDTTFDMYIMATPEPPVLSFNIPECPGDPFFLSATAEANSTIAWTGPNNFNSTLFDVTFPLDESGMGIYTAFVTSEYGCISDTSEIDATITYTMSFNDFDFPNVISANDDGSNDFLDLKSYFMTCDEFTLYIFNRWGNLVFEQGQNTAFFRGQDANGNDLEDGVYTYKLIFENYEKHGFIHVVR